MQFSRRCPAKSFSMADPQAPVNAVAEAQANYKLCYQLTSCTVLPDDVPQPEPVAAQVLAQVQVEANELSFDVCKFYLCTPLPPVVFQLSVFMCLLCFSFAGVFQVLYSRCVGNYEFHVPFKFAMLLDLPFYFSAFHNFKNQFNCCPRFYFTLAGYF